MRRLARTVVPCAGLVALAACASSGAAPDPDPAPRVSVGLDGSTGPAGSVGTAGAAAGNFGTLTRDNSAEVVTVAVPTDTVFQAVIRAYDALGLTPNTLVSASGTVAMRTTRVRGRLGKTNLSEYINCGRDAVGNPTADSYSVVLTVDTRVAPKSGSESTVATKVLAEAQNPAVSGAAVPCGSTGRLESRMGAEVRRQLAKSGAPASG